MRRAMVGVAGGLAGLSSLASVAAAGPTMEGRPLAIRAEAVEVAPASLHPSVRRIGAWVLTSDAPDFGGFSGMVVEDGRLTAITDRGRWLTARLDLADVLTLSEARMAPMRGADGRPLEAPFNDAEALARQGEALIVAFEREHRVMRHTSGGRMVPLAGLPGAPLDFNAGLEGLATLEGARMIGVVEAQRDGGVPVFVLDGETLEAAPRLPARSRHDVTGADADATHLYLVRRFFSRETGVSIRLDRYALQDGLPDPSSATDLAAWESESGIDNMEAVALDGATLWLLSDDNFNPPQRTLLIALSLAP